MISNVPSNLRKRLLREKNLQNRVDTDTSEQQLSSFSIIFILSLFSCILTCSHSCCSSSSFPLSPVFITLSQGGQQHFTNIYTVSLYSFILKALEEVVKREAFPDRIMGLYGQVRMYLQRSYPLPTKSKLRFCMSSLYTNASLYFCCELSPVCLLLEGKWSWIKD